MKNQFPILENNPKLAFLDNAASTQKPQVVIDAIKDYYESSNANVHRGLYKLSEIATEKYEQARRSVASFLNSQPKEIIFTQGTTDSINSLAQMLERKTDESHTIVTTELEHHSNFLPWQRLCQKTGAKHELIKLNQNLEFDLDHLENILKSNNVKLVSISGMSNVTGYIPDLERITKLVHENGAWIHVDAAQLVAHKKIDLKKLDVDFLSFSGHKIYGPTGIGVLFGKKELLEKLEPFRVGGGMIQEVFREKSTWSELPEKLEAGTPNIAGAIGLEAAIKFIQEIGFDKIEKHEKELTEYTLEQLKNSEYIKLFTPKPENHSSVISFEFEDIHPHDVAQILDENDVAVRAGHHCCQILMREVLKVQSTTRVSFGIYNDRYDVDKLIDALNKVQMVFR